MPRTIPHGFDDFLSQAVTKNIHQNNNLCYIHTIIKKILNLS